MTLLTTEPNVLVSALCAPTTSLLSREVIAPGGRACEEADRETLNFCVERNAEVGDQSFSDSG